MLDSELAQRLAESLAEARIAVRVGAAKNSYRRDSPREYAAVMAYLDGGPRPDVTTHMGRHLVLEEDVRIELTRRQTIPLTPYNCYWGARIAGPFYVDCYGAPDIDVPFDGSEAADANYGLFVNHVGKAPTCLQWSGASASNWPPPAFSTSLNQNTRDLGAFTEYAFGSTATGVADMLAGGATAMNYIRDRLAIPMRDSGYPILFRPFWEQNISVWRWGRSYLSAAQYLTLWHNVWQVFQDNGATNVSFAWCPNIFFSGSSQQTTYALATLPPDEEYDWLCFDGYLGTTWWSDSNYRTPEQVYGYTYDTLASFHATKPMGICEWGITADIGTPFKQGFFTAMLDPTTGWLATEAPRIKLIEYFQDASFSIPAQDSIPFEKDSTSCPTLPTAPYTAFRNAIQSNYYAANIVSNSTFPDDAKVPVP
jgi:hypothetical protein